nr:hypothetical protein [Sphingomonas sp. Y57]
MTGPGEITRWVTCVGYDCNVSFLYDWQTMITGILAVIAARWALHAAKEQVQVARDQIALSQAEADRDRNGRLRAARAGLPAALSSVCDYAMENAATIWKARPEVDPYQAEDPTAFQQWKLQLKLLTTPAIIITTAERVLELTADEQVASRLELLLRELQIFDARAREFRVGRDVTNHEEAEFLLQLAGIYTLAGTLFSYGRGERPSAAPLPTLADVSSTLLFWNMIDPKINQVLELRRESGLLPWYHGIVPGDDD